MIPKTRRLRPNPGGCVNGINDETREAYLSMKEDFITGERRSESVLLHDDLCAFIRENIYYGNVLYEVNDWSIDGSMPYVPTGAIRTLENDDSTKETKAVCYWCQATTSTLYNKCEYCGRPVEGEK